MIDASTVVRRQTQTRNHPVFMRDRNAAWTNILVIPDVGDGLTREERVVLHAFHEIQRERGERNVPTAMLWGRVCEHFTSVPKISPRCWRGSARVTDRPAAT